MAGSPVVVEGTMARSADAAAHSLSASVVVRHPLRRLWLRTHLYLGLLVGALFVLISLTGSLLVFNQAIDEWLNPELMTTSGSGPYRPLGEIVAAAQAAGPPGGSLDSLNVPQRARGAFLAWYKIPTDRPEEFRWFQVTVDPYTGTVLAKDREWGGYLVSFIYELHESLLFEKTGETIVGFIALFLLVSVGTGIYLWWPRSGRIRQALTFSSGSRSAIRRHYDWHKLTGFYSAIVLFVLAFTGVYLEFSTYVIPIVRLFSSVQEFPKDHELSSRPVAGARPLSVEDAVDLARQVFSDGELRSVSIPHGETGIFRVTMRQPDEIGESGGQSLVWLDQYSGAVLRKHDWRTFTAGETFLSWLFPLHNGEAFGLTGRWIVCVSGFVPLVLYVTAVRMWWLKRAAHRRQQAEAAR